MVVVFPAPFGPRKPRISPVLTSNEMSFTAVCSPYTLVRFRTEMDMGSEGLFRFIGKAECLYTEMYRS